MSGVWGNSWRSAAGWLLVLSLALLPGVGMTAESSPSWLVSPLAVSASSPLEAQILGEKPATPPAISPRALLQDISPAPSLEQDSSGGATLRLPQNFRVSFLYHNDRPVGSLERQVQFPLLFKYSVDYSLLPNLQVGLSGFLYQSPADPLSFQRRYGSTVMGWGPSLKYDLGRWSFTFRSQLESGRPDGVQDFQNWFRVWYAF